MKEIKLFKPEARKTNPIMYKGIEITELVFPHLCTFWHNGIKQIGMLNKGYNYPEEDIYELHCLIPYSEKDSINRVSTNTNLKQLLEAWDVEFKNGKVIIFDSY